LEKIETTLFKIQAVMLYPGDPDERQCYVRLRQGLHTTQKPGQYAKGLEGLDSTFKEFYTLKEPEMQKRYAQGRLAGGILVLIKQLQDHAVEEGVNKAIHMLVQSHKTGDYICPIPTGRTSLQHYWSHFKSVAHLWADVFLRKHHVICPQPHPHPSPEKIVAFLARAEWFRRFGEQHLTRRSNPPMPTLPPEYTWSVPAEVTLPIVDLKLPRLTGHQLQYLETYINPNLFGKQSQSVR
jgi:hypothetical protein